jgi:hypothetical protein
MMTRLTDALYRRLKVATPVAVVGFRGLWDHGLRLSIESMEARMSALSIRRDRPPAVLRKLAQGEADARVARRMLAIATALDGMSREAVAVSAGGGPCRAAAAT